MPSPIRAPLLVTAICAALALPLSVGAEEDAGAYLAARVAGVNDDYREASHWFGRALAADPDNVNLMEGAVIAHIGAGNYDAAIAVAKSLAATGGGSQAAQIVLVADRIKRGDFATIRADLSAGKSVGLLLDGLLAAWAELGNGRMSEAQEEFDKLSKTPGLEAFGLYHKALALASVGDFEGAESILSGQATGGTLQLLRRGTVARAQILSQLERNPEALAVLETAFPGDSDPAMTELKARIAAGEPVPFDVTRNVTDGMAEVFFTLAVALGGEAADAYTLIYARTAAYLRADHSEAVLMAGALLENQKQFGLAIDAYASIPRENSAYFAAEVGRARALQGEDKVDAALEVLTALAKDNPNVLGVHLARADMLRSAERWAEATTSYDAALALAPAGDPAFWSVYFSRAISLERQKLWDRAEADFRKALELEPDQPQVLNYLGYSFLERGVNFEEALAMIETAAAARPDSGYIIDSLAWGRFLAGRYEEAVEPMERASLLEPVDPVVTDHLGDVYWAVGRKLEARFQWRRALSFDPEEKDATRIRRKLELGLDAVLAEEGARPLSDRTDAN